MGLEWLHIIDFTLLAVLLGVATFLKRKIGFFRKFLIPNSMIAGFLGLILGVEVLKVFQFTPERLGMYVYHLMAVGFISLALKDRRIQENGYVVKTGAYIVSTYVVQGLIGFGLSLILVFTFFPDLFPPMGLLLPLGFGQGPGQAYSIGSQWEKLGFSHGANIGLSVATIGFLWACIGGIILINFLVKIRKMKPVAGDGSAIAKIEEQDTSGDIPLSESVDRFSLQLAMIGTVYLVTYLTLKGLSLILVNMGIFGKTLAQLLWGFHFIIGALYAIGLRLVFNLMKKMKIMNRNYPNNYLLSRISGASFDFMVTAAIAAISISVFKQYMVPILLITTAGGLLTVVYTVVVCRKVFKIDLLEYIVGLYGMLTGTISTGMALLREVDPDFRTHVAENLVFGSGVGLFLGLPMMIVLNIPIVGYVTGRPVLYVYTLLALFVYLIFLLFIVLRKGGKRQVE